MNALTQRLSALLQRDLSEKCSSAAYAIMIDGQIIAEDSMGRNPIRGGTDGARLSYEGLPCPNLSTGGLNFHSIHEFIPVRSLEKMVEVLRNLVTL